MVRRKKEYPAIDIAKYASALLVLAIHTFPFAQISEKFNLFFISTICRLAVPFFFTASAFFFFRKYRGQSFDDPKPFYAFEWRIFKLYLVWTVIYLPYTIWNYSQAGGSVLFNILSYIRNFLLNGSYYHLWFLPALMIGMAIVYYSLSYLGTKKTIILCLVLYLFGYVINVYGPLLEKIPYVSMVYGFYIAAFSTARNGFFFAPVFLLLGLFFSNGRFMKLKASSLGFTISFFLLILEVSLYYLYGILTDMSCMFIFVIPCTFFLMNMLLKARIPDSPQFKILRKDSVIIYCSQILFAVPLQALFPEANLVVYFFTLGLCQLLAAVIVRLAQKWKFLNVLM